MERILLYGMTDNRGGIEAYLYNYLMQIAPEGNMIFDFVTDYSTIAYQDELKMLGCKIYYIPSRRENLFVHMKKLHKIVKEHKEYKKIYFNILSAAEFFTVLSACGIPGKKRIVHSHNNSVKAIRKHCILRPFLNMVTNQRLACSESAGEFMFGEKYIKKKQVTILNNAIDLNKYAYAKDVRDVVRKKNKLEDEFVVGHVGRLCYQKNTFFLIDIFSEIYKKCKDTVLIIIGDGEDRQEVEKYIKAKGMESNIKLLGMRDDVSDFMQAMDVFVLPSRFEGLPVVAIEAQAAGLPCFLSRQITEKTDVTGNVQFLSLHKTAEEWADNILRTRGWSRMNTKGMLQKAGYDIALEADKLEKILGVN